MRKEREMVEGRRGREGEGEGRKGEEEEGRGRRKGGHSAPIWPNIGKIRFLPNKNSQKYMNELSLWRAIFKVELLK